MRCVHCFFTDELDDKPRKKLQMTTRADRRASARRSAATRRADHRRRRAVHAQGPARRSCSAFYKNNKLESIYLMSNGQIQQRIIPDVTRILEECPELNVTVALGIDGLKEDHEKIRQKPGSWDIAIDTARKLQEIKKRVSAARHPDLHLLHEQQSGPDLRVVRLSQARAEADKVNINYIRPPSAGPRSSRSTQRDIAKLAQMIGDDSRHGAIKNNYAGEAGFFKAAIDIYMHELIAKHAKRRSRRSSVLRGNGGRGDLRRGHGLELREPAAGRQSARLRLGLPEALELAGDGGAARSRSPTAASARTSRTATTRRSPSIRSTWCRSRSSSGR